MLLVARSNIFRLLAQSSETAIIVAHCFPCRYILSAGVYDGRSNLRVVPKLFYASRRPLGDHIVMLNEIAQHLVRKTALPKGRGSEHNYIWNRQCAQGFNCPSETRNVFGSCRTPAVQYYYVGVGSPNDTPNTTSFMLRQFG
jgi:hypothetical protein